MKKALFTKWPWLTLLLCAAAIVAQPFASSLTFRPAEAGAAVTWLTGHFVHWDRSHLLWDVIAFALLAAAVELRGGRATLLVTTAFAALAGSVTFAVAHPGLVSYRGLSGIDAALFAWLACSLAGKSGLTRWLGVGLLIGFVAKTIGELAGGVSLFAAGDWTNLPSVHLAGAAAGVVAWVLGTATSRRSRGRRSISVELHEVCRCERVLVVPNDRRLPLAPDDGGDVEAAGG